MTRLVKHVPLILSDEDRYEDRHHGSIVDNGIRKYALKSFCCIVFCLSLLLCPSFKVGLKQWRKEKLHMLNLTQSLFH